MKHDYSCRTQLVKRACWLLGFDYERGKSGPADEQLGIWYWHRSCEMGDLGGCVALAKMTLEGRGTQRDPERAYQIFSYACENDELWGCTFKGRALLRGEGVAKDVDAAIVAYAKGCKLGVESACRAEADLRQKHGTK